MTFCLRSPAVSLIRVTVSVILMIQLLSWIGGRIIGQSDEVNIDQDSYQQ